MVWFGTGCQPDCLVNRFPFLIVRFLPLGLVLQIQSKVYMNRVMSASESVSDVIRQDGITSL
jgi:hypothetical protein